MKPRLILHIGTHKTGTTTLQALMAAHCPALAAAGICYPDTSRSRVPHLPKHASLYGALVAGPEAFAREYGLITEEFTRSGAHTLVLSEEGLSGPRCHEFGVMARFAEDFDVTVVCYLRRQDRLAESLWNQYCREGHEKQQIARYIRRERVRLRLDYLRMLSFWQAIGTVRAVCYETAVQGAGLVPSFVDVTGLPLPVGEDRRENVSPSMSCAAVLAELNRQGIAADWHDIERALGPAARRTALGAGLRRALLDRFAGVNAALAERFGVAFDADLPDEPEEPLAAPTPEALQRLLSAPAAPASPAAPETPRKRRTGRQARVSDVIHTLAGMRAQGGPLGWSDIGAALEAIGNPQALQAFRRLGGQVPCQAPAQDLAEEELRFLSLFLVLAERHETYHALLRGYDPALDLFGRDAAHRFGGSGLAAGALNGCRRVTTPEGDVFEKIYFRKSQIGRNISFFHRRLQGQVARAVDIPALHLLNPGRKLLQCLVAFHDLSGLRPAPLARRLDIIGRLAALDTPLPPASPPTPLHTDFERRQWFRRGRKSLLAVLAGRGNLASADRLGRRLDALIRVVGESPRYFCHGDLSNSNVFENGLVIDWDVCGRLPFGWDAAWLVRGRLREDSLARAEAFFDEALRQGRAQDDVHRFCFLFFLMLFHAFERGAKSSGGFLEEVFLHLEDRRPLLA